MDPKDKKAMREMVRTVYGEVARSGGKNAGCGCGCGTGDGLARKIGYSEDELAAVPEQANLGLGCGNPTAIAGLKEGENVLDLGSGAGLDCFLAAAKVGPGGHVIGVDMTPEMIERARQNAAAEGRQNVEFRLGRIEDLPVEDSSVDVVISNCVINLSVDKPRVFRELNRVLKPGGRIAISDIALLRTLPRMALESVEAYVGCVAGAILIEEYEKLVKDAGFTAIKIKARDLSGLADQFRADPLGRKISEAFGPEDPEAYIASIDVSARRS